MVLHHPSPFDCRPPRQYLSRMRGGFQWFVCACLLVIGCKPSQHSVPAGNPARGHDGDAFKGEISFPSEGRTLHGWLLKPPGAGPFHAIVYNHGSERDPSLTWMGATADFFQQHGYVVFLPFRRGSGGSEGTYWQDVVEYTPGLPGQARVKALEAENADVVAAVHWLRSQPFVDSRKLSVAGCSFGGIHTVLAAEKPIGIVAAVDFAGASMTWQKSLALQERLKRAVVAAQAPIFFVQAANDFDTAPSRVLSAEMERVGKPNRVKIYPPHGATPMEGHAHFCNHGQSEWGDDVLAFLRESER